MRICWLSPNTRHVYNHVAMRGALGSLQEKRRLCFAFYSERRAENLIAVSQILSSSTSECLKKNTPGTATASSHIFSRSIFLIKGNSRQMADICSVDLRSGNKLLPFKKEEEVSQWRAADFKWEEVQNASWPSPCDMNESMTDQEQSHGRQH